MQKRMIAGISTLRGTRRMKLDPFIAKIAEHHHEDVGQDKGEVDGVHDLGCGLEDHRSRAQPLHEQHADDDGGDRVARDAEDQRRHPRASQAALLAVPASTIGSMWPVPNFSGSFERWREMAVHIQAAMSAPAPGMMPTITPMMFERSMLPR